jgi:hypothetical protein
MTVTVSPIGTAHVISAPSTFPRFLGRFAGIAPAQVAPLDFNIGSGRTDSGVVVVYEGQVDVNAEKQVFARTVSSRGALGTEIVVAQSAELASVASMTFEHPGVRDFFGVAFRANSGEIVARFFKNDGTPMNSGLASVIADEGVIYQGLLYHSSRVNRGPSAALNPYYDAGPVFTVVWGSGVEAGGLLSFLLPRSTSLFPQSGIEYCLYYSVAGKKDADVRFPATISPSNPRFNACAQIAKLSYSTPSQSLFAVAHQTDNGEIWVRFFQGDGKLFGSCAVGFGDYPTITKLWWTTDIGGKPPMTLHHAVVAWHDYRSDEIKYSIVSVNPTAPSSGYGSTPVGSLREELVSSIVKGSSSGRPAMTELTLGGSIKDEIGFVIVWEDEVHRITARVFHSKGDPVTDAFNIYDASHAAAPSVIATPKGFYVVWMDLEGDTEAPLWSIKGQFWEINVT